MMRRLSVWCLEHPALTFIIIAIFMALDSFILGPFSYIKWHDLGDSHFSRFAALATLSAEHGVFYWFPQAASGVDILSNGFRFFDIFFIAFKTLPDWLVIALARLAQIFIAGWFTYLICLEMLMLSRVASLAGGLFLALLQYNLMEHYFGLGAMPLIAWSLERLHRQAGWKPWLLTVVFATAYSFFTTAHLAIVYAYPAIFFWLFFVRSLRTWRLILLFSAFTIFSLLPQMSMIVAMLVNTPFSHREYWDMSSPYFDQRYLYGFEVVWRRMPQFLLCVAAAVPAIRYRRYPQLFLMGLIVAILAIVSADILIRQSLGGVIGFVRMFNFARFAEVLPFFLCVGAAWGLDDLVKKFQTLPAMGGRDGKIIALLFATTLTWTAAYPAIAMIENIRDWVMWGNYTAIFRSPNVETLATESLSSPEPFRVASVQENGLQASFASAYGLEAADGYLNAYPHRYHQFWEMVTEPFLSRHQAAWDYFKNNGNRISLLTDDGHSLPLDVSSYFRMNLLSLANVRYILTSVPLNSPDLELVEKTRPDRFWDELSTGEKIRRRLKENFTGRHVMVYRNRSVLPRWFLAGSVAFYGDEREMAAMMADTSAKGLARTALFEAAHAEAFAGKIEADADGVITPEIYSPDLIRLKVSSGGKTVLVVTNTYSPFWKADIDGRRTDILPVYGTFWGLPLEAGEHTVEFNYEPPYILFPRGRRTP